MQTRGGVVEINLFKLFKLHCEEFFLDNTVENSLGNIYELSSYLCLTAMSVLDFGSFWLKM